MEGLTLRAPGQATFLAAPLLVGSVATWATLAGPEAGIGTSGFALLIAGCLAPWLPSIAPGPHSVGMS